MKKFIESLEIIEDKRQSSKVRHKIQDVIVVVLMGTLVNVNTWKNRDICRSSLRIFKAIYTIRKWNTIT